MYKMSERVGVPAFFCVGDDIFFVVVEVRHWQVRDTSILYKNGGSFSWNLFIDLV